MTNDDWKKFFEICRQVLGKGASTATESRSWCSWTTFDRLVADAGYWTAGIPSGDDLRDDHIADGGIWGQPFYYRELAHVIVPRTFDQESVTGGEYHCVRRGQDLATLSRLLRECGIEYRISDQVLEIKLF